MACISKGSEADPRRGKPSKPRPAKQAEPTVCQSSLIGPLMTLNEISPPCLCMEFRGGADYEGFGPWAHKPMGPLDGDVRAKNHFENFFRLRDAGPPGDPQIMENSNNSTKDLCFFTNNIVFWVSRPRSLQPTLHFSIWSDLGDRHFWGHPTTQY